MLTSLIKVVILGLILLGFGYFLMYSKKILSYMTARKDSISRTYSKHVGKHVRKANVKVIRRAELNHDTLYYKAYKFLDDLIRDLDMVKDGVTVAGLLAFIIFVSSAITIVFATIFNAMNVFLLMFGAVAFLIITLLRFAAISNIEQREADIMDSVDLLVSDVKGGIMNAIIRYKDSFPVGVRPYFHEFLDDIQNKGYGFRLAMNKLNEKMGMSFTEFAQKAILYEEKADKNMDDIFSSIIEINRQRRTLRYTNNIEFANLRLQFIVSIMAILGYAIFAMFTDSYIMTFLTDTMIGKIMIIIDIIIITFVLSYMAAIKAKSL